MDWEFEWIGSCVGFLVGLTVWFLIPKNKKHDLWLLGWLNVVGYGQGKFTGWRWIRILRKTIYNYVGSLSTEDEHDDDDEDEDEDEDEWEEEEGRCEYLESWPTVGKQVRMVLTCGSTTFEIKSSIEQLIS